MTTMAFNVTTRRQSGTLFVCDLSRLVVVLVSLVGRFAAALDWLFGRLIWANSDSDSVQFYCRLQCKVPNWNFKFNPIADCGLNAQLQWLPVQ